jgi:uncharacterized membrane protein YjjP (DUF1212 family)
MTIPEGLDNEGLTDCLPSGLKEECDFLSEYATRLMGVGVHTSRVIRNTKRIGMALGLEVHISGFHRTLIFTVNEEATGKSRSFVSDIAPLPNNFRLNSELSKLSWQALDEHLEFDEIKKRYWMLVNQPSLNPWLVMLLTALANLSFCALFGGDWAARLMVFADTLAGVLLKRWLTVNGTSAYISFICCSFVASMIVCGLVCIVPTDTAEVALATSVLFLIPGVPLINGFIDIVEGHILNGFSRLTEGALLVLCIAVGLAVTISITKFTIN